MFKKFTWGHGVVLALASFMIFILSMIFAFSRGWQNSEMVSDHYYEDELVYQDIIDAKNNLDARSEKPIYEQTTEYISVKFPNSYNVDGRSIKMELFRTDDSKLDIKKDVLLDSENKLTLPKTVLVKGSYTLKLKWTEAKKPYQIDYILEWK